MTKALETDFEAKAEQADHDAANAIHHAKNAMLDINPDEAVSYLRDAIDAIRAAEGWRAAAQAIADAAVRKAGS